MKKCKKCLNNKRLTDFYKTNKGLYYTHCKKCHCEKTANWYMNNKDSHDERNREWYKMNKEQHNKNSKHWYTQNPEKALSKYLRKYKITLQNFNDLLKKQNNKCAICKIEANKLKIRISVDHCHKTGIVRGLLCQSCNRALGFLKEDIKVLKTAIKYLERGIK